MSTQLLYQTFFVKQQIAHQIRYKMQAQQQHSHKHQQGNQQCNCNLSEEQQISKQLSQKLTINPSNQHGQNPSSNNQQNQQQQQRQQQQQQKDQQRQQQQQDQDQDQEQEQGSASQQQQTNNNSKWKKIQQPQKTVKLFMIDFAHCDAKKCSGKKLERFKLLTTLDKKKNFKGVVLSAFGKKQCSFQDLQYAQKYGVCVVDCSWNRIQQTRQFRFKHQRKLPFVTAGNPVNYGKPYQLSCAEALATALCSIGYIDQAEYIMSKFGWSDGFWSLNPLIENYSKCKTLDQLKKESKAIEQKGNQKFVRNYDLSDPESSGEQQQN